MKNYIEAWQIGIDEFDLALYKNAKEALEKAKSIYLDKEETNYCIIEVEGYKCIAHTSNNFAPFELDCDIIPFDDEKIYPLQELKTVYQFRRVLKMKKTLELEKRGMDFLVYDKMAFESNCKNYRLRAMDIFTKEGYILRTVDFIAGLRYEYNFKNGKPRKKPKLIKKLFLNVEASYCTLDNDGNIIYKRYERIEYDARTKYYNYTLEDILKCVNSIAKVTYTDIKII